MEHDKCPHCGEEMEAEFVDIGIGKMQVTEYVCSKNNCEYWIWMEEQEKVKWVLRLPSGEYISSLGLDDNVTLTSNNIEDAEKLSGSDAIYWAKHFECKYVKLEREKYDEQ